MKIFITMLMVVLACLCLIQDANAWNPPKASDRNTCGKKNPNVVNAIETFCFKNKNMVSILQRSARACADSLTCGRSSHLPKLEMVQHPGPAASTSGSEEVRQSLSYLQGEHKLTVSVPAKCKPPQWVPEKYCFQNFFNMCVNMNKNNKVTAYYGKDGGCQGWRIRQD